MVDSDEDEDARLLEATCMMNLYDTNYDGKVSKEEFVKASSKLFKKIIFTKSERKYS